MLPVLTQAMIGDFVQTLFAKERDEVGIEVTALVSHVLAVRLCHPCKVFLGRFGEAAVKLATRGQIEAFMARISAPCLDGLLGLFTGYTLAFATDRAVDALSINHHVD